MAIGRCVMVLRFQERQCTDTERQTWTRNDSVQARNDSVQTRRDSVPGGVMLSDRL